MLKFYIIYLIPINMIYAVNFSYCFLFLSFTTLLLNLNLFLFYVQLVSNTSKAIQTRKSIN